jgi:bifunctional enzyme CysN/CysC
VFDAIEREYASSPRGSASGRDRRIPISALKGRQRHAQRRHALVPGPTLMEYLETVEVEDAARAVPLAGAVGEPAGQDFRGFAGTIAAATCGGRRVRVLPSGARAGSRASSPWTATSSRRCRPVVTLTLADEIDVSRGDVLAAADAPPAVADQFEATLIWMHEEPCCRAART